MLLQPGRSALFVVEANGRRFIGSRDFDLKSISRRGNGFVAILCDQQIGMHAYCKPHHTEGCDCPPNLRTASAKALDFKVAFHVSAG